MKKVIGITLVLLLVFACASVVRKLDQDTVGKIRKGTTRSQVFDLVRMPDKAYYSKDSDLIWSYVYLPKTAAAPAGTPAADTTTTSASAQERTLTITFGPDGVVKNVVPSPGTDTKTTVSPGVKVDAPNTEENRKPK